MSPFLLALMSVLDANAHAALAMTWAVDGALGLVLGLLAWRLHNERLIPREFVFADVVEDADGGDE